MIASSLGHIATRGAKKVRKQTLKQGYFQVNCNNHKEKVHNLVARAFHGVPEDEEVSVDHINGNTQDNRANQLQWATASEQNKNRKKRKPQSNGEACLVWRVHGGEYPNDTSAKAMEPIGEEQEFLSAHDAANQLMLSMGSLSRIFRKKIYKVKSKKDGFWYTGRLKNANVELEGEEWAEKKICCISNHGRIRTRKSGTNGVRCGCRLKATRMGTRWCVESLSTSRGRDFFCGTYAAWPGRVGSH